MGHIYARVRVSREPGGPSVEVTLLVDTGATSAVIPKRILRALGIEPLRREKFELADGRTIERSVAGAFLSFRDREAPTLVVLGESGDTAVLGTLAMEELGLELDPRSEEIRPAKRFLVTARRLPAPASA